jgi:hypothetical protein
MQSVFSPIVGYLSDILDRKYLASIPPFVAFAGADIFAKSTSIPLQVNFGNRDIPVMWRLRN